MDKELPLEEEEPEEAAAEDDEDEAEEGKEDDVEDAGGYAAPLWSHLHSGSQVLDPQIQNCFFMGSTVSGKAPLRQHLRSHSTSKL